MCEEHRLFSSNCSKDSSHQFSLVCVRVDDALIENCDVLVPELFEKRVLVRFKVVIVFSEMA